MDRVSIGAFSAPGPRLAIWGTFDIANFGDQLFPRIFEHEMLRRLADARVTAFSPLGYLHPIPLAGGRIVEPLGEWEPSRLAELEAESDLVAIGGGEIIHTGDEAYAQYYGATLDEARRLQPSRFFIEGLGEFELRCPVAWHSVGIPFDFDAGTADRIRRALEGRAYVSVRDEFSRARLVEAGVTREIALVPDSALLFDRVVGEEQLRKRLGYLRELEAYPVEERPLVVQGSRLLLPHVESIAGALTAALREHGEVPIVLLETGPCHGDAEFGDAMSARFGGAVYRMPPEATVEDVVAAIVNSRGFVGTSLHGHVLACARGLPGAILDLACGFSKLAGFASIARCEDALVRTRGDLEGAIRRTLTGASRADGVGDLVRRVDEHFDTLAEIAERSARRRLERSPGAAARDGEVRASEQRLRRAFEARGRRLLEQRLRMADEIDGLERRLRGSEKRVAELQGSRVFRYTTTARAVYARLRRVAK